LFAAFMMPDLRLAAWLLWMMPLLAALSSRVEAESAAALAASASPASIAVCTFLMAVFSSDLNARLRWCAFSLVRTRFFWLLMFATVV